MSDARPPLEPRPVSFPLRRRAALAGFLVTMAVLAPRAAFPQAEEAEALIRQGMDLRKQNQDARALPLLEKAYKLSRTPRTAAQLGLVQMALGYWVESERHLDEALADPDNPWITRNRDALAAARGRVRGMIGQVTIAGEPRGAEVFVNGRSVGRLPLSEPVRIGKGPVEVELRADGYVTASRSLTVAGGGQEQVTLALARAAASPPEPAATGPAPAVAAAAAPPPAATAAMVEKPAPAPAAGGGAVPRGLAWGTAAVGVAGLAFGVVETLAMQSKLDAFNNHTAPNGQTKDCTTTNLTPECAALRDDYDGAKTLAIVGYVAGGVFAAGSVVLFVLSSPAHAGAGEARAGAPPNNVVFTGCAPSLASAGAVCGLRF